MLSLFSSSLVTGAVVINEVAAKADELPHGPTELCGAADWAEL